MRFRPFRFLEDALAPAWIAGAVSAVATVALGLMHATEDSLRTSRPSTPTADVIIYTGLTAKDVPVETKIMTPAN